MKKQVVPWTNTIILPILGFISGITSFYVTSATHFEYFPGVIFAIFIGLYYSFFRNMNILLVIFLTLLSTVAYFCATKIAVLIFFGLGSVFHPHSALPIEVIASFSAGAVGSTILYYSYLLTLGSPTYKNLTLFILSGGILGLSCLLLGQDSYTFYNKSGLPDFYMSLFVFWQTGMAFLTGVYFLADNLMGIRIVRKARSSK